MRTDLRYIAGQYPVASSQMPEKISILDTFWLPATGYLGVRTTYVGRPTAPKRCITSRAGDSSGVSAWNLIFTKPSSAVFTEGSTNVVLSIVRQFLHHVAHMSISTGLFSRCATARPSARSACQPSFRSSFTLD